MRPRPVVPVCRTPLSSWLPDGSAAARLRRHLGRRPVLLLPRDGGWRTLAPVFAGAWAMATSGLPAHVVADRRVDRSGDPHRLRRALAGGSTVLLPQVHQVLPRLTRLMVALRAVLFAPRREECSYLFLVEGTGRPGMGLHHDGDVDAVWLQLEGRRTLTVGPPVPRHAPADLPDRLAAGGRRAGWRTRDLEPGSLLYLPPFTPHAVVCRGRSLAVTLTWRRRGAPRVMGGRGGPVVALARDEAAALTAWDVVAGHADPMPRPSRGALWTQAPAVAGPVEARRGDFPLWTADAEWRLPVALRPLARRLLTMPRIDASAAAGRAAWGPLLEAGILAPRDLPLAIRPDDLAGLDGWRFA